MYVGINLQLLYCFALKGNVLNCQYLRNWGCLGFFVSSFLNIMEDRVDITQEPENGKNAAQCSSLDVTWLLYS